MSRRSPRRRRAFLLVLVTTPKHLQARITRGQARVTVVSTFMAGNVGRAARALSSAKLIGHLPKEKTMGSSDDSWDIFGVELPRRLGYKIDNGMDPWDE